MIDKLSWESGDVWKVHSEKSGNKYKAKSSTITTIAQGKKPCQFQKRFKQTLNVSIQNWANQFSEKIFFESLILAQDERWRRA